MNKIDWVKSVSTKDRICLSSQMLDLLHAAQCRFGREILINEAMSKKFKDTPRFEMMPGSLYFIHSRYFADFADCAGLEKNKILLTVAGKATYVTGFRPYAYAFTDEAGLHWMAPLSGKTDIYKNIERESETKYPSTKFMIARADGSEAAVLIHKMCPVSSDYLYCPVVSEHEIGKTASLDPDYIDKFLLYTKVAYRNTKSEIDMGVPLNMRSITCEAEKAEKRLLQMEYDKYYVTGFGTELQINNEIDESYDYAAQER